MTFEKNRRDILKAMAVFPLSPALAIPDAVKASEEYELRFAGKLLLTIRRYSDGGFRVYRNGQFWQHTGTTQGGWQIHAYSDSNGDSKIKFRYRDGVIDVDYFAIYG